MTFKWQPGEVVEVHSKPGRGRLQHRRAGEGRCRRHSKSSMQKGGGAYFREHMVHVDLYCVHYLMAYGVESLKV